MSTTFVFNPTHKRESLEDFNKRVKHFCLNKDCISAEVGALGGSLILNLHDVDSIELEVGDTVMVDFVLPVVFEISDADKMLEEHIAEMFASCEFKSNKDPIVPLSQQFVKSSVRDGKQHGFFVVLCDIGGQEITGEEDFTEAEYKKE